MKIEVTKILAEGTNKRFMWIKLNNDIKCIRINNEIYKYLKQHGVITSQKLRAIKESIRKELLPKL